MTDRLRVGLMSPGWPPEKFANGIVTFVATLAPQLRAMGHEVTILAGEVAPGDESDDVRAVNSARIPRSLPRRAIDGVSYRIAPRTTARAMARRAFAQTVRRLAAERPVDVIEMEETLGMSRWVQAAGVPVCLRLHGPWFLNGPAVGAAADRAFRDRVRREGEAIGAADAVCAPSRDVLERVRSRYEMDLPDAQVIPNPVASPPASELWRLDACDRRTILFVGRFDRHKGGDLMVDAFARVLARRPDARLRFVGPDAGFAADDGRRWGFEEYVRDRIPGALESGRVEWLGRQPASALGALRRGALVSVICSRYENFPYTVTEALAAGCPVVAARVAGIPEIVEEGENGLLHAAGDAADLAAKIESLLADPERAASLGRCAALTAQRLLSPEAIAPRIVELYRRVLARRAPSR